MQVGDYDPLDPLLGTDFPTSPYPYSVRLAALCGWASADARLGVGFLRSAVHDTRARLLGLVLP